jgi:hypothetical protein
LFVQIISGQDKALEILKKEERVRKLTILDTGILIQFDGGEKEEAMLLRELILGGVSVLSFSRDNTYFEKSVLNMISGQEE